MQKLVIAPLLVLLAACTVENVRPTVELDNGDGILVLNMVCDPEASYIEVYTQGSYSDGLTGAFNRDAVITCFEPTLKTVRLSEGDYFVGKLGAGASFADVAEQRAIKFTVRRDKLNYVGDLVFRARQPVGGSRTTYVAMTVEDKSEEAREELSSTYPELYSRYEYIVSIASR